MMIRKTIALACLLLACSMGYADSLERFVNRYKEKEGAVCRVFNKDRHFNDVPEEDVSPEAQRLVSGMLAVMGARSGCHSSWSGVLSPRANDLPIMCSMRFPLTMHCSRRAIIVISMSTMPMRSLPMWASELR